MACTYILDGKELTYEEFAQKLQEGLMKEVLDAVTKMENEERLVGLSKAEMKKLSEEIGVDAPERKGKITDAELEEMAERAIQNGYDAKMVVDKLLDDKQQYIPTALDILILTKREADLKAKFDENPTEENLAELRNLMQAARYASERTGQALRAFAFKRQVERDTRFDFYAGTMEAAGTERLTEEQKAQSDKYYERYKQASERADQLSKDLENLRIELEAAKKLAESKTKKSAAPKTKEQFKEERKAIIQSIKDKWKAASMGDGTLTAVPVPYAKQLAAIAPDVAKLVASYIEEGYITLEQVSQRLKQDIKEAGIEEVTDYDVKALIAGEYKEQKPRKSELTAKVNLLRQEAKLLKQLEDLESGNYDALPERKKIERNQKIKELVDKIDEVRKRLGLGRFSEEARAESMLKQRLSAAEKEIQKYTERLEKGDFEPEKRLKLTDLDLQRSNPELYKKWKEAITEKENVIFEYEKYKFKEAAKQKSNPYKRFFDFVRSTFSTFQNIKAGIDFSVIFQQAFIPTVSNPRKAVKSFMAAKSFFKSKKEFEEAMAVMHNSPYWNLIKESGLTVFEPRSLEDRLRDDVFQGNRSFLNKDVKINGKTYNIGEATTMRFERFVTGYTNTMRLLLFFERANKMFDEGKTFETHPEEFKSAARMANELTGVGKLPKGLDMASPYITPIIWSPKMLASTFNVLGITDVGAKFIGRKGFYASLTPSERKFAAQQVGTFILAVTGAALSAAMIGAADELDLDPESTSFGELKYADGKKSINIYGRFGSAVKSIVQSVTGKRKVAGKEDVLGETKYGATSSFDKNRGDVLFGAFVRGKMTPAAGLGYDALNGFVDYYSKEKIEVSELPQRLITPMSLEGLVKDLDKDGIRALFELPAKLSGLQMKDVRDYEESSRDFSKKFSGGQRMFDDYIKIKYAKGKEYEESPNNIFPKKAPEAVMVDEVPVKLSSEEKKAWDNTVLELYKNIMPDILNDKIKMNGKTYSQLDDETKLDVLVSISKRVNNKVQDEYKKLKETKKDVSEVIKDVQEKMPKMIDKALIKTDIYQFLNEKENIPNNKQ